jgi:hypothetical protein
MAYFEYTPSYSETVSTALARGGSLFEAKNGYLEPGDTFRINNGTGYTKPANDLAQNTIGSTLKKAKSQSVQSNPAHLDFNKKMLPKTTNPGVGDLYFVGRADRVTGLLTVRNMIDFDADDGGGWNPEIQNTISIQAPLSQQSFESDETVTVSGIASSDVVSSATAFYLAIEKLDDNGSGAGNISYIEITPTASWSTTFTGDSLTYPIITNAQISLTMWAMDGNNLLATDSMTMNIRPDGDALIATYGTVVPVLNLMGEDGVTTSYPFPAVDNSASVSTTITLPTNLDGAEAGNDRLLSDASIELLANEKTIGVDFGAMWLVLFPSEPGVSPEAVNIGGDMNVRIGAGFNADGAYDNNDTGLSQAFQVMDASFGGTAKMELISATGGVLEIASSINTSAGAGTYTQSSIDLSTLGAGSTPVTAGANYRIKVTSNTDDDMYCYTEYFTIKSSLASLTLTSPTTGEEKYFGDSITVTWTSQTN